MKELVANELYKALKSKRIYIFMSILFLAAVLIGVLINNLKIDMAKELQGAIYPVTFLSSITDFLLPIFVTLIVTFLITDEYQNGTFKLPLLHGLSRKKLFIAKIISQIILTFLLFVVAIISSYIIGAILWGGKMFVIDIFINNLKVYGLTFLIFISYMLLISFLGMNLSNSGIVIGVSITILVFGSFIAQLAKKLDPFLITYYMKAFCGDIRGNNLLYGIVNAAVYGVVFYILSITTLVRKEIVK